MFLPQFLNPPWHFTLGTANLDTRWRLLENLEAGMIGMNTGKLFLLTKNPISDCVFY